MARAATTTDAFNAIAEPRRREILDALVGGERPVNDLVRMLGLAQPQVSKHLRVLSDAGLVQVRPVAQQRIYGLRAEGLKELDDWLEGYRRLWGERFEQLDGVLRGLQQEKGKQDGHHK